MIYIGIKDGKIFDICFPLTNKRTADQGISLSKAEIESIDYVEINHEMDLMVGDTWENGVSLKDAPKRFEEPEPTDFELLEERVLNLETVIILLEERIRKLEEVRKE